MICEILGAECKNKLKVKTEEKEIEVNAVGKCRSCPIAMDKILKRIAPGRMLSGGIQNAGDALSVRETFQEGDKKVTYTFTVRDGVYHDEKHI